MKKKMLVKMCRDKDSKRKRKLFEYYRSYFDQGLSAQFTADLINADLGEPLVTLYDIKYIRAHAAEWIG